MNQFKASGAAKLDGQTPEKLGILRGGKDLNPSITDELIEKRQKKYASLYEGQAPCKKIITSPLHNADKPKIKPAKLKEYYSTCTAARPIPANTKNYQAVVSVVYDRLPLFTEKLAMNLQQHETVLARFRDGEINKRFIARRMAEIKRAEKLINELVKIEKLIRTL